MVVFGVILKKMHSPCCPLRTLRHRPVAVDRTGIIRIFVVQTTD